MTDESLAIDYGSHPTVQCLLDTMSYCLEGISMGFDRYGEPLVKGPGAYFVVVTGHSVAEFADPMGDNRWPIGDCLEVLADVDCFYEAARDVSLSNDGAVIVSVDGVITEQMVRIKDDPAGEDVEYADWMGSRHMSAIDTSLRTDVVATMTLSEESGRVSRFVDGEITTTQREKIGGPWRTVE